MNKEEKDLMMMEYLSKKNSYKLNEFITLQRIKKGYSIEAIANRLDIPVSAYRDLESGKTPITKRILKDLIKILNISKKVLKLAYDNDKPFYAKKLIELRMSKGFTQKLVAFMLQINAPTYSNYEQGTREPDIKTLIKISQLYGVSIDEIVGNHPSNV